MGQGSSERGISNSFSLGSPSFTGSKGLKFLQKEQRKIASLKRGGKNLAAQRSNRSSTGGRCRFLQPPVLSTQREWRMEASVGRIRSQQVGQENAFFDGIIQDSVASNSARGLDDYHRYEGCIFPHPGASRQQEVSKVCFQRGVLSVPCHVFRTKHGSTGIHKSASSICEIGSPCRFQNAAIFRRLANSGSVERGDGKGQRICVKPSKTVRFDDKRNQVFIIPGSGGDLPGNDHKFEPFLGFPHPEKSTESVINACRIQKLRGIDSQEMASIARTDVIPRGSSRGVSTKNQTISIPSERTLVQEEAGEIAPSANPVRIKTRARVVAEGGQTGGGSVTQEKAPRPCVVLRRFKSGLGGNNRGISLLRSLDKRGREMAHKQLGAVGSMEGLKGIGEPSYQQGNSGPWRQYNSFVIHRKKRRNKIKGSVPVNKRTLSVDRREERHPNYSVCAGDEEFHSRLPQQEESSNPNRMDTSLVSMSRSVEEVGGTDGGPFRHCLKPSTSFVLLSSLRPKSSRSGCNASRLEQHGSVCLPSVCNDQTSHKQTKEFKEHEDDPDRTLVASEGMVPGPSGDDNRPSSSSPAKERLVKTTSQQISAPKPPHASASRVETVHRLIRARGFSGRIARSIFGARGPSTNKLYQHQWETYFKWCKENKISSTRTSVSSICEFLWYLRYKKKLAVPTIKGYRAMLSSVLRHVGLDFSSNKDIQDLIKAFQREVPRQPAKSLSWNLDVVLKFLCSSKFEPLTEASELRLTQKTLFLIALALAKRVSELQAMSRRVGFSSHEAHLSLLYSFRAKNDNKCKALPRSFVIKDLASLVGEEEERLLCPVRALKIYLKRTKELVGKSHDHLFAGVKKPERPLSKNGISYYIRSLIREAHSECNPDSYELLKVRTHEVRGVGTSFNFVKNMSLEDVMNAAQWRCNGVFASHYFRDISVSYDDCRRLGPFVAAGTVIS